MQCFTSGARICRFVSEQNLERSAKKRPSLEGEKAALLRGFVKPPGSVVVISGEARTGLYGPAQCRDGVVEFSESVLTKRQECVRWRTEWVVTGSESSRISDFGLQTVRYRTFSWPHVAVSCIVFLSAVPARRTAD